MDDSDLETVRRVAKDTAIPKRQRIMDVFAREGFDNELDVNDISGMSRGLHHQTIKNECEVLWLCKENAGKDSNRS